MTGWWKQLEADIVAAGTALEREHQAAIVAGAPRPPQPERVPEASPAVGPQSGSQMARLDEFLGQTADAAGRLAADRADREARAEYATRLEREAQAEPEPALQPQVREQTEMEL